MIKTAQVTSVHHTVYDDGVRIGFLVDRTICDCDSKVWAFFNADMSEELFTAGTYDEIMDMVRSSDHA